jgi:hypothetical protein
VAVQKGGESLDGALFEQKRDVHGRCLQLILIRVPEALHRLVGQGMIRKGDSAVLSCSRCRLVEEQVRQADKRTWLNVVKLAANDLDWRSKSALRNMDCAADSESCRGRPNGHTRQGCGGHLGRSGVRLFSPCTPLHGGLRSHLRGHSQQARQFQPAVAQMHICPLYKRALGVTKVSKWAWMSYCACSQAVRPRTYADEVVSLSAPMSAKRIRSGGSSWHSDPRMASRFSCVRA